MTINTQSRSLRSPFMFFKQSKRYPLTILHIGLKYCLRSLIKLWITCIFSFSCTCKWKNANTIGFAHYYFRMTFWSQCHICSNFFFKSMCIKAAMELCFFLAAGQVLYKNSKISLKTNFFKKKLKYKNVRDQI